MFHSLSSAFGGLESFLMASLELMHPTANIGSRNAATVRSTDNLFISSLLFTHDWTATKTPRRRRWSQTLFGGRVCQLGCGGQLRSEMTQTLPPAGKARDKGNSREVGIR